MPGNDSYTKVLLHMDGSNGGTTFTDSNAGGAAKTWTATTAVTNTGAFEFGTASMNCGSTGWIDTPDSADFTVGTGDFTIDFWFNVQGGAGASRTAFGQADNTASTASTSLYANLSASNVWQANLYIGTTITTVMGTTTFTTTGWHHFAYVRASGVLKMFLDGVQEGGNVSQAGSVNDSANKLAVGRFGELSTFSWNGFIDEFRFSVGVARWTANFTPPAAPYDTQYVNNAPLPLVQRVFSSPPQAAPYNINIYANPSPFFSTDRPRVVGVPLVGPPQSLPLNINLFTNPLPFTSTDRPMVWRAPQIAPAPPQAQPYNINLFTNPIPFVSTDRPSVWNAPRFAPHLPTINLPLLNQQSTPFVQTDWNTTRDPRLTPINGSFSFDLILNANSLLTSTTRRPLYIRGVSYWKGVQ